METTSPLCWFVEVLGYNKTLHGLENVSHNLTASSSRWELVDSLFLGTIFFPIFFQYGDGGGKSS